MNFCKVLKNSFDKIDNMLDDTQINEFKGIKYDELWQCHFGLGIWVRNNILNDKSRLYNMFSEAGITHLDDMSDLLIKLYYIHSHNKDDCE